jgi:Manganese containing catalase
MERSYPCSSTRPACSSSPSPIARSGVRAHKLQELLGGAYGEMTVAMRYLFQGPNCRMAGKYKDLIMDIATEEMGHVEMVAIMAARLLEGAPATLPPRLLLPIGAVLGGMDPQQAIVAWAGAPLRRLRSDAVGRLLLTVLNAVNASQLGGQLRTASVPALLLFDSYLPLVFLWF